MRKRIATFLTAAMLLSFFGCASSQGYPGDALQEGTTSLPMPVPTETTAEILETESAQAAEESSVAAEDTHPTETAEDAPATEATEAAQPTHAVQTYILNTNTRKFHVPACSSAAKIKASNRKDFHGTREEVIQMGYTPCKNCNP